MKKQEKRRIAVLLLLLLIVVIVKVRMGKGGENNDVNNHLPVEDKIKEEFVEVLEDGTKLNKSEQLSRAKTVGALEFNNIQLTNQNGQTLLLADVKNTGEAATTVQLIDVIILDKKGEQIGKISGIISPLEPEETVQFNTSTLEDYANAYDFQIVNKEVE